MKAIILSVIAIGLMIGAPPSAMAIQKPYWSATPLSLSCDYKQYHVILTRINYNLSFDIGKTKVSLTVYNSTTLLPIETRSHIVDVAKEIKPSEENATLDVGYFIVPASIAGPNGGALAVGVRVLKEDFTVESPVNTTTMYVDMDDYYQTG